MKRLLRKPIIYLCESAKTKNITVITSRQVLFSFFLLQRIVFFYYIGKYFIILL